MNEKKSNESFESADSILERINARKQSFGDDFYENNSDLFEKPKQEIKNSSKTEKTNKSVIDKGTENKKRSKVRRFSFSFSFFLKSFLFLFIIFIVVFAIGFQVFIIKSEEPGKQLFENLRVEKDKGNLYEINKDIYGWLSIDLTPIDYPVVYRKNDNHNYLYKDVYGNYNANGMLIMDKKSSADESTGCILIHGHDMRSGMMFGSLKRFQDDGYRQDHSIITFETVDESRNYRIIDVYTSKVDFRQGLNFNYYDYEKIPDSEGRLLVLATCDYSLKNHIVIVAKLDE